MLVILQNAYSRKSQYRGVSFIIFVFYIPNWNFFHWRQKRFVLRPLSPQHCVYFGRYQYFGPVDIFKQKKNWNLIMQLKPLIIFDEKRTIKTKLTNKNVNILNMFCTSTDYIYSKNTDVFYFRSVKRLKYYHYFCYRLS